MPQHSAHLESAKALLGEIPAQLVALQDEYKECVRLLSVSPKFRAQTLSYLVGLRAILDYLAHDLAPFLSKAPSKLYFPVAKKGVPRANFEQALTKKWLPGLCATRPDIYSYLISVQHFHTGNEWITAFHELSNLNKHVRLSMMTIGGCNATIVRVLGQPRMQIGDRGLQQLSISAGGTLAFDTRGVKLAIRGPQVIDGSTKNLLDADLGIDIAHATWTEFKFDQFPSQPAIVFLEIAEKEVRRIATQLEAML